MKFKDFLKASKCVTDSGKWVTGKPNKKLLELSKGKFSLGSQWTWRKIVLEASGHTFHIAVAFHAAKQEYVAHLAVVSGHDCLVLASIENHGTHPGWHLHVNCQGEGGTNVGRLRYPAQSRIPGGSKPHRERRIPIAEASALAPLEEFFCVDMTTNDGMSRKLPW